MLGQASPVVLINVERITIMKKIMMNIKAQVKRFTEFYANDGLIRLPRVFFLILVETFLFRYTINYS